jgi:hypothetical protein
MDAEDRHGQPAGGEEFSPADHELSPDGIDRHVLPRLALAAGRSALTVPQTMCSRTASFS